MFSAICQTYRNNSVNLVIEHCTPISFVDGNFEKMILYITCMILSSETEQITHGSFGFHEKSEILAVCPPWMNNNSGGPSSASSADCSSPILDKSHTCRRRSVPDEAKMVSLWGDHWTCRKHYYVFIEKRQLYL